MYTETVEQTNRERETNIHGNGRADEQTRKRSSRRTDRETNVHIRKGKRPEAMADIINKCVKKSGVANKEDTACPNLAGTGGEGGGGGRGNTAVNDFTHRSSVRAGDLWRIVRRGFARLYHCVIKMTIHSRE